MTLFAGWRSGAKVNQPLASDTAQCHGLRLITDTVVGKRFDYHLLAAVSDGAFIHAYGSHPRYIVMRPSFAHHILSTRHVR